MSSSFSVIGIDPGLVNVGWAIVNFYCGRKSLVASGNIRTTPKKNLAQRLLFISNQLKEVLKKYSPRVAAIEEIFIDRGKQTFLSFAQARGVLLLTLVESKLEIFAYSASEVKQYFCGYGRACKKSLKNVLNLLINIPTHVQNEHEVDAVAIAVCCYLKTLREKRRKRDAIKA